VRKRSKPSSANPSPIRRVLTGRGRGVDAAPWISPVGAIGTVVTTCASGKSSRMLARLPMQSSSIRVVYTVSRRDPTRLCSVASKEGPCSATPVSIRSARSCARTRYSDRFGVIAGIKTNYLGETVLCFGTFTDIEVKSTGIDRTLCGKSGRGLYQGPPAQKPLRPPVVHRKVPSTHPPREPTWSRATLPGQVREMRTSR
jgi:hypothetical protein